MKGQLDDSLTRVSQISEKDQTTLKPMCSRHSSVELSCAQQESDLKKDSFDQQEQLDQFRDETTHVIQNESTVIVREETTLVIQNESTDVIRNEKNYVTQNETTDVLRDETTDVLRDETTHVIQTQTTAIDSSKACGLPPNDVQKTSLTNNPTTLKTKLTKVDDKSLVVNPDNVDNLSVGLSTNEFGTSVKPTQDPEVSAKHEEIAKQDLDNRTTVNQIAICLDPLGENFVEQETSPAIRLPSRMNSSKRASEQITQENVFFVNTSDILEDSSENADPAETDLINSSGVSLARFLLSQRIDSALDLATQKLEVHPAPIINPILVIPVEEPVTEPRNDSDPCHEVTSQTDTNTEELLEFSCHFEDDEDSRNLLDEDDLLPPLEDDLLTDSFEVQDPLWIRSQSTKAHLSSENSSTEILSENSKLNFAPEHPDRYLDLERDHANEQPTALGISPKTSIDRSIQPRVNLEPNCLGKTSVTPSWKKLQGKKNIIPNEPRRVTVHYKDGVTRRGIMTQYSPIEKFYQLEPIPNSQQKPERLDPSTLKAIFVMLPIGYDHPRKSGRLCKINLIDGHTLQGYTNDYRSSENAFTLIPLENKGNIEQVVVFRDSVINIWLED